MKKVIVYLLLVLCFSCEQDPKSLDADEFGKWLAENSALTKSKVVNDINLNIKHLPNSFQAYREMTASGITETKSNLDSLTKSYQGGVTFLLSFNTEDPKYNAQSLTNYGITSQSEYKERIHILNFGMQEFVKVYIGEKSFALVLVNYSSSAELGKNIDLILVFPSEILDEATNTNNDLDLVYDDPFWGLGTNHFLFKRESIKNIPALNL